MAETLAKAKNTSVSGMVDANILASGHGKVRLLRPVRLAREQGTGDRGQIDMFAD